MNLAPLTELIELASLGLRGKTIFLNMMPAAAENAILLRSPLQGTKIDYELPGYFRTEFQLIVRGQGGKYLDTQSLIESVILAITLNNQTVGALHFNYCRPRTEPVSFPLSDGNLIEFSTNFDVSFVKV